MSSYTHEYLSHFLDHFYDKIPVEEFKFTFVARILEEENTLSLVRSSRTHLSSNSVPKKEDMQNSSQGSDSSDLSYVSH